MNEFVITNEPSRKRAAFMLMQEKKQTIRQFMRQWGGVLYRDLIKWTPPRSKETGEETWGMQKKRGEAAVRRDIKKVFRGPEDLINILSLHPLVQKSPMLLDFMRILVNTGDTSRLTLLLAKLGSKIVFTDQPSRELHFPNRNRRGVVRKVRQQYYVLKESKIEGYVKEIQKDVGKAKAGWVTDNLPRRGVPGWVMRHKGIDGGRVDLDGPVYRVSLQNTSKHTVGMRANEIVTPALRILDRKMRKSLQAIAAWRRR